MISADKVFERIMDGEQPMFDDKSIFAADPQVAAEEVRRPAVEQRDFRRRQIYVADGARVEVTTRHGLAHGYVIDLDPRGLRIAIPKGPLWDYCVAGEQVEVTIASPTTLHSEAIPAQIMSVRKMTNDLGEFLTLGVHLRPTSTSDLARARLSGFQTYQCPPFFRPIGFCASPFFLNEVIHFQIQAIRAQGLVALTSRRNQGLFPGMVVTLTLTIPNVGEFGTNVRILAVTAQANAMHTEVEMSLIQPDPELQAALGEFVLSFAKGVTIRMLQEQGFFLDTIYRAIRITTPANSDDWQAIGQLRLRAYQSVGKLTDRNDPLEALDAYDRYARQIIARIGDRIVGAARVVFCGSELARSEHHALGVPIPDAVVAAGFVEFSRFCTDPEFRGGDIFVSLMRQATLVTLKAKIPNIVANCNPDLFAIYRKIGFRYAGEQFTAFGRSDCRLIIGDVRRTVLYGRSSEPVLWNQTVLPVTKFAALDNQRTALRWHPWIIVQFAIDRWIATLRRAKNYGRHERNRDRNTPDVTGRPANEDSRPPAR